MSILVVHLFEVIAVKYTYGHTESLSAADPGLYIIDIFGKGTFVTDGSEGIVIDSLVEVFDLCFFFICFAHEFYVAHGQDKEQQQDS